MNVPMADLKAQYNSLKREIDEAVRRVIESGRFILGPEVETFEKETAAYLGVEHAVGVASGTDALRIALVACGIKPGDEVITTPFTFIATTGAITHCGATPVFVDIDPETYNIDPAKIESKITERTRAILPVHLYGQSADMELVLKLATKYNLQVIEDCAQALGSEYKGKKVGSLGSAGCFSFFPSKILGAYGDGGIITTSDGEIAEKVDMLRKHGSKISYYYSMSGFNSRLDALQAAILRVKLRHLDQWIEQRRQKAALYSELLANIDGVETPYQAEYTYHVFNYYTIRLRNRRNELQKFLATQGVSTTVYYPLSLHLQEVYRNLGYKTGSLPQSEKAQEETLSLPMYPELEEKHIERIAVAIRRFSSETD
ncbi:DegT/DnrJ/EryC1/StrS family aminotransferase [Chloroflexota bacterium]